MKETYTGATHELLQETLDFLATVAGALDHFQIRALNLHAKLRAALSRLPDPPASHTPGTPPVGGDIGGVPMPDVR